MDPRQAPEVRVADPSQDRARQAPEVRVADPSQAREVVLEVVKAGLIAGVNPAASPAEARRGMQGVIWFASSSLLCVFGVVFAWWAR